MRKGQRSEQDGQDTGSRHARNGRSDQVYLSIHYRSGGFRRRQGGYDRPRWRSGLSGKGGDREDGSWCRRSEEHTSELQSRLHLLFPLFFFNDTATTEIYTLSLHDALPICKEVTIGLVGEAVYLAKEAIAKTVHGVGFPPLPELIGKLVKSNIPLFFLFV